MGKISDLLRPDRYRSQARLYAGRTNSTYSSNTPGQPILPLHATPTEPALNTGGSDVEKDAAAPSQQSSPLPPPPRDGILINHHCASPAAADNQHDLDTSSHHIPPDAAVPESPFSAPPPIKSEAASSGDAAVGSTPDGNVTSKPTIPTRMWAGCKRFGVHTKNALFHSWVNVLLVFVPVGIAMEAVGASPAIIFAMNAIAIIPLAGMLTLATENVAARLGDTLGALLNVSFGNAVELIIFIIALVKNEVRIVQASILGSILANLLLILGMAILLGGLRYREQVYNSTVTQMSACLLSLSVMSLLLPTAFHATFNANNANAANDAVLKVSRGTSVILLIVYVLYLLFQLKSHAYMYESTPQEIIDEESHPGVLHDMLGSSSSSDDDSSSDSSDSDSDGSGSIITKGKKIRNKMFNRRRRKSSASVSSTTQSSVGHSALSSPSTTERQGNYWESQVNTNMPARNGSGLGAIASVDEGDADNENGGRPRIRDFVVPSEEQAPLDKESSKSPERKKHGKKHRHRKQSKKHQRHHDAEKETAKEANVSLVVEDEKSVPSGPKVEFADQVQTDQGQVTDQTPTGKLPFNRRGLPSRQSFRPALPKMLSNTVFTQPAPVPEPVIRRPGPPPHAKTEAIRHVRRTSSLPDRLNARISAQPSSSTPTPHVARTDPLPPYQHQRQQLSKTKSHDTDDTASQDEEAPSMSRTAAVVLLLCSTALVAVCAEFMVDAIPEMIGDGSTVSEAFIGLIILPIVGNAAEHVTAVTVAAKNKMDLAIGVALGSSIQIALFVTPVVVLLGWILNTDMSLYFNIFETVSLFVTAFIINFLVLDGRSNYLEGSLLIAGYVIIAICAFFYPGTDAQSDIGGGAVSM
nr:vacuolar calcium ion transporter [Quercus suber]